jgi:hypothetical protein
MQKKALFCFAKFRLTYLTCSGKYLLTSGKLSFGQTEALLEIKTKDSFIFENH